MSDPGRPFDPLTEAQGAELGRDSEATEIGGLGVHLIKQLTDEQRYEHSGGRNILQVTKALPDDS